MDRRHFLQTASIALGAAAVTTACGSDGDEGGVADLPAPTADQSLFVQAASFEFLAGPQRYLAFGVTDVENRPLPEGADVRVFLRSVPMAADEEATVLAGPLEATYSPPVETGQGIYYLQTDLEDAGIVEIVALSGDDHGTAAVQIVDPANSRVINPANSEPVVPGTMAISTPTPTTQDDRGVFSICTQNPPCGMHEMSLDEALDSGRPVALIFATPQFCQTVVCGPSVATLEHLRADRDWGDTVFVHSEIFAEEPTGTDVAGTPIADAVVAWGLPTEPWFFTIGTDGVIVDRIDGPMPEPVLAAMLDALA